MRGGDASPQEKRGSRRWKAGLHTHARWPLARGLEPGGAWRRAGAGRGPSSPGGLGSIAAGQQRRRRPEFESPSTRYAAMKPGGGRMRECVCFVWACRSSEKEGRSGVRAGNERLPLPATCAPLLRGSCGSRFAVRGSPGFGGSVVVTRPAFLLLCICIFVFCAQKACLPPPQGRQAAF